MKNLLNYYYNLIVLDFKKNGESYTFNINKDKYMFIPFYEDVKTFYEKYALIKSVHKYCHEVILNKDNSIITLFNNQPYILLKKNLFSNNLINIDDILQYDTIVYKDSKLIWDSLWKNKIDYYEYQMNQFGFKYPLLKETFSYYIGLSELAISLLNLVNKKEVNNYIVHKRIKCKEKQDEFLNPVNIIIDTRVRDIAEYFKVNIINNFFNMEEIIKWLDVINLNYNESILLLSRLIYPSYYFDLYDLIIQEKQEEKSINFYIQKNVYYETFLRNIYQYIKSKYKSIQIEWLEFK